MTKLVLLDRDGVLNEEVPGYVKSPEELLMIPGAAEAVAKLNKAGIKVVVTTNQSAVGRGIISEEKLAEIHNKLRREIEKEGGWLDEILYSPDAPDKATNRRKPGPGMLQEAMKKFNTDPLETEMLGDNFTDYQAASAAGCRFSLVLTGRGGNTFKEKKLDLSDSKIYSSILEAVNDILSRLASRQNEKAGRV